MFVGEIARELQDLIESELKSFLKPEDLDIISSWNETINGKIESILRKYLDTSTRFVIGAASDDDNDQNSISDLSIEKASESSVAEFVPINSTNSPLTFPPVLPFVPPVASINENSITDSDDSIIEEIRTERLKLRNLEVKFDPRFYPCKAVCLRRRFIERQYNIPAAVIASLPYKDYKYEEVKDACCENVIGFVPIPTGMVGPLKFGGEKILIPMSTTEGALIASVNRGCKAINKAIDSGNKLYVDVYKDGMTRAPLIEFHHLEDAILCRRWIEEPENFSVIKRCFESRSRHLNLIEVKCILSGRSLCLRFNSTTGDAMGMNMVTGATSSALKIIQSEFNGKILNVIISGNMCVDKKSSAINWLEGRGKSVAAQAIIPDSIVESILHTTVDKMVSLAKAKLLIGSSTSVTIGGWNAHAANIVAAIFLATGQDAAQVVSSSSCMTELNKQDGSLSITCTMPCLEVGTVGGGTILTPQRACLKMLGCYDDSIHTQTRGQSGNYSKRLARIICTAVLAGELSLLASQCTEGDLEQSHIRLNRSKMNLPSLSNNDFTNNMLPYFALKPSSLSSVVDDITGGAPNLPAYADNTATVIRTITTTTSHNQQQQKFHQQLSVPGRGDPKNQSSNTPSDPTNSQLNSYSNNKTAANKNNTNSNTINTNNSNHHQQSQQQQQQNRRGAKLLSKISANKKEFLKEADLKCNPV